MPIKMYIPSISSTISLFSSSLLFFLCFVSLLYKPIPLIFLTSASILTQTAHAYCILNIPRVRGQASDCVTCAASRWEERNKKKKERKKPNVWA